MTETPKAFIEIFLNPGEFYFGDQTTRIRTILGSCVAITMWHPTLLIGGMCHYVLPSRIHNPSDPLDGRYADEAMTLFLQEIKRSHTHIDDYQVKIFGGGKMFDLQSQKGHCGRTPCNELIDSNCKSVSCRNIYAAKMLVQKHQLNVKGSCLGGHGHRKLFLDIWSGHVWSKRVPKL